MIFMSRMIGVYMRLDEMITPCYIFDEKEFEKNIEMFKNALNRHFNNSVLAYSFKTNPLPRLLAIVKENGCWAEVVSDSEYRLAKKMGFDSTNIIFNGPVKSEELFVTAINDGTTINIDSNRELQWIGKLDRLKKYSVGVRVNFDLESKLPGHTSTGEFGGRFGFCYENGELHRTLQFLKSFENIRVSGLHMHVSNKSKSVEVYRLLTEMACRIMKEESLELDYLDIGGGFFGGGDDGEAYEKYISVIHDAVKIHGIDDVKLIIEPGASVAATAFSYKTSVVDIKDTNYGRFVITDGTRLHIDPFLHKNKYNYSLAANVNKEYCTQVICGYTCMENDRIMTIDDIKLDISDTIVYRNVGSYTLGFNSNFISFLPRVYGKRNDEYCLVRDQWTCDEYLEKNKWMTE